MDFFVKNHVDFNYENDIMKPSWNGFQKKKYTNKQEATGNDEDIRDVAKLAGVSPSTVSRVMNEQQK